MEIKGVKKPQPDPQVAALIKALTYWSPLINTSVGNAAPPADMLRDGLCAYADGVNWNPLGTGTPGDVVYYNGAWHGAAGGGITAIASASDVSVSSPAAHNLIVYDDTAPGKWKNTPGAFVSVLHPKFGADPTGVADSTAAFAAAIATGKKVFVPKGSYLVSLTSTAQNVHIEGESKVNTFIYSKNTNTPAIWFDNSVNYPGLKWGVTIENITFRAGASNTTVSGNCALRFDSYAKIHLNNIEIAGNSYVGYFYNGIELHNAYMTWLEWVPVDNVKNDAVYIKGDGLDGAGNRAASIFINNCQFNGSGRYGINGDDLEDLHVFRTQGFNNLQFVHLDNTHGSGYQNSHVWFLDCAGDTSYDHNWYVANTDRSWYTNCWGSTQADTSHPTACGFYFTSTATHYNLNSCGALTNNGDGISMSGDYGRSDDNTLYGNGGYGLSLSGTADYAHLTYNTYEANVSGTYNVTSSGTNNIIAETANAGGTGRGIGTYYVDGRYGTDDSAHGGSSGAGAFKTITYALTFKPAILYVASHDAAYTGSHVQAYREQVNITYSGLTINCATVPLYSNQAVSAVASRTSATASASVSISGGNFSGSITGYIVTFLDGAQAGKSYPLINAVYGPTVYVETWNGTAPSIGDHFTISDRGVRITGADASADFTGVRANCITVGAGCLDIVINNAKMDYTLSNGYAVTGDTFSSVTLNNCDISHADGWQSINGQAHLNANSCYSHDGDKAISCTGGSGVYLNDCSFKNIANANGGISFDTSKAVLTRCRLDSCQLAINRNSFVDFVGVCSILNWNTGGGNAAAVSFAQFGVTSSAITSQYFSNNTNGNTSALTGLAKWTGTNGALTSSAAKIDYAPPTTGTAIQMGDGAGGFADAVAGTNYQAPVTISSAQLGADVTMTNINQYYDGPSLSLPAGTYRIKAKVNINGTVASIITARLWDGSTTYDESSLRINGAASDIPLVVEWGPITLLATTTIKASVASTGTGCKIAAQVANNGSGTNVASNIMAEKMA